MPTLSNSGSVPPTKVEHAYLSDIRGFTFCCGISYGRCGDSALGVDAMQHTSTQTVTLINVIEMPSFAERHEVYGKDQDQTQYNHGLGNSSILQGHPLS